MHLIRHGAAMLVLVSMVQAQQIFVNIPLSDRISDITFEQDSAWLATNNGAVKIDALGNELARLKPADGLLSYSVIAICYQNGHGLWCGSSKGLTLCSGDVRDTLNMTDGMYNESVMEITTDRQGDLWIGTIDGAVEYTGDTLWNFRSRMQNKVIRGIAADHANRKWLATDWGINIWGDTAKIHSYDQRMGIGGSEVTCVAIAPDSTVYIGSAGGMNVIRENDIYVDPVPLLSTADGLINNTVNDIATDGAGNVWIATAQGASRYQPATNHWTSYDTTAGLLSMNVKKVAVDRQGNIWFCTSKGVSILKRSDNVRYSMAATPAMRTTSLTLLPNPVRGRTTMQYALPNAAHVETWLSSVQGERLVLLDDGHRPVGANHHGIVLPSIAAGTYLLSIETRSGVVGSTIMTVVR